MRKKSGRAFATSPLRGRAFRASVLRPSSLTLGITPTDILASSRRSRSCCMGKRSAFERREGDFYPTPRAAVLPLIPHLRGVRTFAEPCCGDGDLVRHLESFGLV